MNPADLARLLLGVKAAVDRAEAVRAAQPPPAAPRPALLSDIERRIDSIGESTVLTATRSYDQLVPAVHLLRDWMIDGTTVRILGAGRARLAGSIPANRLAHGGARVYIQDDIVPMPHSIKGGGIIAVSASGRTESVLSVLRDLKQKQARVRVLGIANHTASEFQSLCDVFIGIHETGSHNPLRALADTEEFIISMLLDAMVVAAGKMAGFDDTTWRLGHEDLGATGPYSVKAYTPTVTRTVPERPDGRFTGRAEPLHACQKTLFETPGVRALLITGEIGIGKSSLARELFDRRSRGFERAVSVSAYAKSWSRVLAELAEQLRLNVSTTSSVEEIENAVVAEAAQRALLIYVDNIRRAKSEREQVRRFVEAWAAQEKSRLLLTGEPMLPLPPGCRVYELKGLTEPFEIVAMLGDVMTRRIESWKLWNELAHLQGHPQKLVELMWLSPTTPELFAKAVADLAAPDQDSGALSHVLDELGVPFDHFLALGLVRATDFDDALLAHLWDRLGLGVTELYARSLKQLFEMKLLTASGPGLVRMSAHVHRQLEQPLMHRLGPRQAALIHYFIGEFYRQRFAQNTDDKARLIDLESYTYHTIQSGNPDTAVAYVFSNDAVELAQQGGLAVELEPLLSHLHDAVHRDDRAKMDGEHAIMAAAVEVEFGRVHKDLSRHAQCLESMESAAAFLDHADAVQPGDRRIRILRARLEHFKGIAFSQIGHTSDCITSYAASVSHASELTELAQLLALSLGYLAYELKFHDIATAVPAARRAVALSEQLGDSGILVKNICSLGQIESFAGNIDGSFKSFERANKLKAGRRERGRILVNSVVSYLGARRWKDALMELDAADEALESGDKRRKAMSQAYRGILEFHEGHRDLGMALVHQAFQTHSTLPAYREALYEALTYGWMLDASVSRLDRLVTLPGCPDDIRAFAQQQQPEEADTFAAFWLNHYAPTLLTPGTGAGPADVSAGKR